MPMIAEWHHTRILVTGPPRSGTRIAAKIIAHDLDYHYIDEVEFKSWAVSSFCWIVNTQDHIVVQCPTMLDIIEDLVVNWIQGKVLVVLMRRNVADIERSRARLGWSRQASVRKGPDGKYLDTQAMYDYWDEYQKPLIPHHFELEYESLAGHELWVPKEEREGWEWNQTEAQ